MGCSVAPVNDVAHSISKLLGVPHILYELQNGEFPGHRGGEVEVGPAGQFGAEYVAVEVNDV